jgi:hypothetical protein
VLLANVLVPATAQGRRRRSSVSRRRSR